MDMDIKSMAREASYRTAWESIKRFGAFYFVVRKEDGHSFFRRSKRHLPEKKIGEIYTDKLQQEITRWHKK